MVLSDTPYNLLVQGEDIRRCLHSRYSFLFPLCCSQDYATVSLSQDLRSGGPEVTPVETYETWGETRVGDAISVKSPTQGDPRRKPSLPLGLVRRSRNLGSAMLPES